MTNYDWPFETLPFGLFWSNLDTRDLKTCPSLEIRSYSKWSLQNSWGSMRPLVDCDIYECRRVQRSQIFKWNLIILIHIWVQESAEVPNLQVESNYIDSFKLYCIFRYLRPQALAGVGVGVGVSEDPPTCLHMHTHAYMCVTLKYTCIEIANGHPHGDIHVYYV